ncbi:hypothetical protein [Tropicimonas aquimaris]|uniref:Transposase n=1 Tax=Tropicimonas aquimaris TaxID=914152 RepID=A0ABW3IT85_9RHOB
MHNAALPAAGWHGFARHPTLQEPYIHRHRFDGIQHATHSIDDWVSFCNRRHPDQALAMRTPARAFTFVT